MRPNQQTPQGRYTKALDTTAPWVIQYLQLANEDILAPELCPLCREISFPTTTH